MSIQAETIAQIKWSLLTEPGDQDAGELINRIGAEEALARFIEGDAEQHGVPAHAVTRWAIRLPNITPEAIEEVLAATRAADAKIIDPSRYEGLNDLGNHAPRVLWLKGDETALDAPKSLAVTGARAATGYGEHVAAEFAAELAGKGVTIHSGAAYGIDGAAHRAALSVGGATVAWLASGINRPYPAGHAHLIDTISSAPGSALLSENAPGTPPTRWRFLARNRLIAAATTGTLVVEAGYRSRSLNTAGHALALGRNLGAVPGPITSPASSGCHRLIREHGAQIITTADEAATLTQD